ncbi:MAG: AarF/ABC1/UbiB kinase family protein [Myxococcales bacterium]|nr:AarF/ABC1/UbiB kinase family protein [Myxococcales bacterium]
MLLALGILTALTVVVAPIVIWLCASRTGRVDGSRAVRMARIGRLWARLSTSYAGARLRRLFASADRRRVLDADARRAAAAHVAETMGQMKGAFMKLGQMLSFVSDEVPEEFRAALTSLQASAPPMDIALLRAVAEEELGQPLERAFARFDEKPIASASIGQVHRATLPTGEEVAVKIQYPGVADAIRADLGNAAMLYRLVAPLYPGVDTRSVIDELRGRVLEELDYAREADNQREFLKLYDNHPFIRVPRVFASHSTARVLTTEFIAGRRFDEVVGLDEATRSRYGEIIFRFVFGSIIRHGMFNGDPHPGNYLFDEAGRVVFLDFGCVKYFPNDMLVNWRALVISHLAGDRQAFAERLITLGFLPSLDGLDAGVLFDYFGYFYEPIQYDREFSFTRAYNAQSFKQVFRPDGPAKGLNKKLNMPRDFVFVNRIQWGVHSVLAHLNARGNFHRIQREHLFGDAPSTELGRLDAEFRARLASAGPVFATAPVRAIS